MVNGDAVASACSGECFLGMTQPANKTEEKELVYRLQGSYYPLLSLLAERQVNFLTNLNGASYKSNHSFRQITPQLLKENFTQ